MTDFLTLNVNEHTEKKGTLTYLSWAWAWAEVLKVDPDASWETVDYEDERHVRQPCMWLPDGTAMVKVMVTIGGKWKSAILPVMDNRNQAIKNPNAFAINTAIMRCLAKAVAMFGLGLYIYAGEDVPEGETERPKASAARQSPAASSAPVAPPEQAKLDGIKDRLDAKPGNFTPPPGEEAPDMPTEEDRAAYKRGLERAHALTIDTSLYAIDHDTTRKELFRLSAKLKAAIEQQEAAQTALPV